MGLSTHAQAFKWPWAGAAGGAQALSFDLSFIDVARSEVRSAFMDAANLWLAQFNDYVTVKPTFGAGALGGGMLEPTGPRSISHPSQMCAMRSLPTRPVVSSTPRLPTSPPVSVGMPIYRSSDKPNGSWSATPYLDETVYTGRRLV